MADDVVFQGSTPSYPPTDLTVAADKIDGKDYQRVKISQGADGTAVDVSSAAPLQVSLANTGANATPVVVDLGANNDVTVTGTVDLGATDNGVLDAIAASLATIDDSTLGTIVSAIAGTVAHDDADSGNESKIGARATTSLAGLTLVANADRTRLYAGVDGVLIMRPHANLEDIVSGVAAITDGSSTSVIASSGAGVKTYITTAIIANTSATAVTVDLRDGAAGTVKATLPVPANTSGVVCNLPIPLAGSAATAWCADPSAAASTITVTLVGFKSKV